MPDEGVVGARVELDITEYRRAVNQIVADAGRVDDAIDDIVDATRRASRALGDIDADVTVDVMVEDGELDSAKRKRDDLGGSETVDVRVVDDEVDEVHRLINSLAQTSVLIDFGVDLASSILDFDPRDLPIISALTETETAVATFAARTGLEVKGAADIINEVYSGAWGESKAEVGEVITAIAQLTGSTEGAADIAAGAFGTAEIVGDDAVEVLRVAQQLVDTGVVETLAEGFDVIVKGTQEGLNRSGDLLDTISEYAGQFSNAQLSAGQFLSFLQAGVESGVRNTDVLADSFKEASIKIRDAITGEEGIEGIFEGLDITTAQLGIDEAVAKLEISGAMPGAEFWTTFAEGVQEASASGQITEIEAQILFERLFGTQAEEVGAEALIDMLLAFDNPTAWEGTAQSAIDTLTNTFDASWESFTRTVGQELIDGIDERFDIQATLDRARDAVQVFTGEIAAGESLFGALEVALELPGLESQMEQLGATLQNIFIEMLSALGSLISVFNAEIAEEIFTEVERLSAGQLAIDLGVATDTEGLETAVATALRRGVELSEVGTALETAVDESLATADFEGARRLVDTVSGIVGEQSGVEIGFGFGGLDVDTIANLESGLEDFSVSTAAAEEAIDGYAESVGVQMTQGEMMRRGLIDTTTEVETLETTFEGASDTMVSNYDRVAEASVIAGDGMNRGATKGAEGWVHFLRNVAGEPLRAFIAQLQTVAGLSNSAFSPPNIGGGGATGEGPVPGLAAGGTFSGAAMVHQDEIMVASPRAEEIAVLNAATSSDIMSGLGALMGQMGLGGGGGTTNITNNININSQSMAQDISGANQTAVLRGFTG